MARSTENFGPHITSYNAPSLTSKHEHNAREHLAGLCAICCRTATAGHAAAIARAHVPGATRRRADQAIAEQVAVHFHIPIDTVKMAMHVIQHGLGDEVLVGRITLSDACEQCAPRSRRHRPRPRTQSAE